MQPYFFPHLGYFDLINATDKWVVFNTAQYARKGWMNRNRVLDPNKDWQYITVPVEKMPRNTPIKEMKIAHSSPWRQKMLKQLKVIYSSAPFFECVYPLVERTIKPQWIGLENLLIVGITNTCDYLGIDYNLSVYSDMDIDVSDRVNHAGEWALEISKAMGATEYINPPGGEKLFVREDFEAAGIKLTIRDMPPMEYTCSRAFKWVPRLSIIDVMMWNSPQEIKKYLDTWSERHSD